jgi:hypothetical protein
MQERGEAAFAKVAENLSKWNITRRPADGQGAFSDERV